MWAIDSWLRRHWVEAAWALFSIANVVVIFRLSEWETIPFHFIWVSLTLLYGFRVWSVRTTASVLAVVMVVTTVALIWSTAHSNQSPDELSEVPLMAAMFVAMVWHARRRQAAMEETRRLAESEHRLREREREFVRDASHELRTPITVARGHAELIRAEGNEQESADADVVLEALDRLARISERLLILAAAEHPDFLRPVPIEVDEMLDTAIRRWRPAAPDRRWETGANGEVVIEGDRERIDAALDALLENAVKWSREGDRISLSSSVEDGRAVITIEDSGSGIPAVQQDRIFDRFARADGARERGPGGTGLGLAIVKAIIEAHGGSVTVHSAVDEGSSFRLRLPIGAPDRSHDGAGPDRPAAERDNAGVTA
jgi:signal transduction histidine kinase